MALEYIQKTIYTQNDEQIIPKIKFRVICKTENNITIGDDETDYVTAKSNIENHRMQYPSHQTNMS